MTQGPEVNGNYFEVSIVLLGLKDIGIGLADKSTFPVDSRMPGWNDNSYGYHGDDGKKFGENPTPGDWPLFEEGDVIGCGISIDRKTIFFTRNGELLGDCFTDLKITKLSPVVGFSNRHNCVEKVEINFGIKPFRYSGPEIFILPNAAKFREEGEILDQETRIKLEYKNKLDEKKKKNNEIDGMDNKDDICSNDENIEIIDKSVNDTKTSINPLKSPKKRFSNLGKTVSDDYDDSEEEKKELFFQEEKDDENNLKQSDIMTDKNIENIEKNVGKNVEKRSKKDFSPISPIMSETDYCNTLSILEHQVDISNANILELKGLQSTSISLIHFLLSLTCQNNDDNDGNNENENHDDEYVHYSTYKSKKRVKNSTLPNLGTESVTDKNRENDKNGEYALDSKSKDPKGILPSHYYPPVLMKNRSVFGTPLFVTSEDSSLLQKNILSALIREISIITDAFTRMKGGSWTSDSVENENKIQKNHQNNGTNGNIPVQDDIVSVNNSDRCINTPPSYKEHSSLAAIEKEHSLWNHSEGGFISPLLPISNIIKTNKKISKVVCAFSSVEAIEMERILYEHLLSFSALLPVSDSMKRELSGQLATATLFTLLKYGTFRIRTIVSHLLVRTLPDMVPDDVECSLREEWRNNPKKQSSEQSTNNSLNTSYLATPSLPLPQLPILHSQSNESTLLPTLPLPLPLPLPLWRRRQRRLPDTAVQILLSTVRDALSVHNRIRTSSDFTNSIEKLDDSKNSANQRNGKNMVLKTSKSVPHSGDRNGLNDTNITEIVPIRFFDGIRKADIKPFGQGLMALEAADSHICILKILFESDSWKELIACNLTDSLRNAVNILKNRFDSENVLEKEKDGGEEFLLSESEKEKFKESFKVNNNGNHNDTSSNIKNINKISKSKKVSNKVEECSLSLEEENILLSACAACTSLTGLGLIRVGGQVLLNDGNTAILVDLNEVDQTARG